MKRIVILSALLILPAVSIPAYANDCTASAHRVLAFMKEEAKGTRHEAQIQSSIEQHGEGPLVAQVASTLSVDECSFLLVAPDSTIRAMAISMLPERNGE